LLKENFLERVFADFFFKELKIFHFKLSQKLLIKNFLQINPKKMTGQM